MKIDTTNPEYDPAFKKFIYLILEDPILKVPDFTKKFILRTDASDVASGAVLSQDTLLVTLTERLMNTRSITTQMRKNSWPLYGRHKTFRHYLLGRHFEISSDHQPLRWLYRMKDPNLIFT